MEKSSPSNPPCILTIAGSDSGGGAGIQADLKTIAILGGFGLSVITALTAQNGLGVTGIHTPDPSFIELQLNTIYEGFFVNVLKTGMLFSVPIIEIVKNIIKKQQTLAVIDPVCVSQSGYQLLEHTAIDALRTHILPLAMLVTPNKPEAELLTEMQIESEKDIYIAGKRLIDMGAKAVLIKGGHFYKNNLVTNYVDWYIEKNSTNPIPLSQPAIKTKNNHGTGCTLSAAIATYIGLGLELKKAILQAQTYLNYCLKFSYTPGKGIGPPNHTAWLNRKL